MSAPLVENPAKLLIVDDEFSLRTLFSMALESEHQQTKCAEDGQSALDTLKNDSFDLVLLDLSMPGKSGLDVLRELRARRDFTKVTIISAYIPGTAILKAVAMGVTNFLGKPMRLQPLREFVDQQLCGAGASPLDRAKKAAQLLDFEQAASELRNQGPPLDPTTSIWLELFEALSLGKSICDLDHLTPRLSLLVD